MGNARQNLCFRNRRESSPTIRRRRRGRGQRRANFAGPHARQNRISLGRLQIVGDPVEKLTPLFDQLVARQIAASAHRQRKTRSAIVKHTIVHAASTANCGSTPGRSTPRSMFARSASFVAVSGSALMNG